MAETTAEEQPPDEGAAPRARPSLWSGAGGLLALLVVQAVCAVFFLVDVAADFLLGQGAGDSGGHLGLELVAALGLAAGLGVTLREVRRLLFRQRRIEARLQAASGAFLDLLDARFDAWALTPSERDVALLAIKGLAIKEIAAIRETRVGTVKAQLTRVYAKAGVSGRPQLLSLFVEDLIGGGLAGEAAAEAGR